MPRDYCAQVELDEDALVSIIPADGWRVELTGVDGTVSDEPLVGWGLTHAGTVVPLSADADGDVEDLTNINNTYRVYHPSSTPTASSESSIASLDGMTRTDDPNTTTGRTPT